VEGQTGNLEIDGMRRRKIRNLFTILLLSQGRPMILMGDKVRHTPGGNNNAYCQDNETSWFDWDQQSHSITSELFNPEVDHGHLFIMLNAYWEPLAFQVPELPTGRRRARLVDTAQPSPADFAEPPVLLDENQHSYPATSRSAIVLIEQTDGQGGNTQ
jgi:glycogen operon protein